MGENGMAEHRCEGVDTAVPQKTVPPRQDRQGVQWVALVICCGVVAVSLVFTPYRFALMSLVVLLPIAVAFYNAVYVVTARMLGLTEVVEFSVGSSPTVARFRINGTQFRMGGVPVGGYVKFPGQGDGGRPSGFMLLHPIRQATIALSGPVLCALTGWALCEVGGADGIFGRIAQWFRAEDLQQWQCWRLAVRTLLIDMSSLHSLPRAAGLFMLAFGLLNLIPLPVLSGGVAARILGEYAAGRKMNEKVWAGIASVGLLPLVAVFCIAFVTFLTVLFKGCNGKGGIAREDAGIGGKGSLGGRGVKCTSKGVIG